MESSLGSNLPIPEAEATSPVPAVMRYTSAEPGQRLASFFCNPDDSIQSVAWGPRPAIFACGFFRGVGIFGSPPLPPRTGIRVDSDDAHTMAVAFDRQGGLFAVQVSNLLHVENDTTTAYPYLPWLPFNEPFPAQASDPYLGPLKEADLWVPPEGASLAVLSRNTVSTVYNLDTHAHVMSLLNVPSSRIYQTCIATKISRDGRRFAVLVWGGKAAASVRVRLTVNSLGSTAEECDHVGTIVVRTEEGMLGGDRDAYLEGTLAWSSPEAGGRVGALVMTNLYVFDENGVRVFAKTDAAVRAFDFFPGAVCELLYVEEAIGGVQRFFRQVAAAAAAAPRQHLFSFVGAAGAERVTQLVIHPDGESVLVVMGNRAEIRSLV